MMNFVVVTRLSLTSKMRIVRLRSSYPRFTFASASLFVELILSLIIFVVRERMDSEPVPPA